MGCETSFDPLNEEKGIYSIYGYLDLNKDINYIRVKDLNKSFGEDTTGEIDANVILENLEDGTTETLKDTVVEFDGVQTFNFRVISDLQYDSKYQLTVNHPDGDGKVIAYATTPSEAEVTLVPEEIDCDTPLTLTFKPVRSKFSLDVEIGFHYKGKIVWARSDQLLEESDETVRAFFTPLSVAYIALGNYNFQCKEFGSKNFYVRYTHYGPDLFDDTFSDTLHIPGGAGRFGALYRETFPFHVNIYSEL